MSLLIKKRLTVLKWGVLYSSFFILSCSSPQTTTVKEKCDTCEAVKSVRANSEVLAVVDSLVLQMDEVYGEINSNIPPKKVGNSLYILTTSNYVLKYALYKGSHMNYQVVAHLPNVYSMVSDYLVQDDSTIIFCSNDGINSITRYNTSDSSYTKDANLDTTICNSMPFLGLSLDQSAGKFLFPLVKMSDVNTNRNFLGVYDQNLNYQYGLGDFRTYEDANYAPYFDAPIMTKIVDGTFYVTSSSSNGALRCNLIMSNGKFRLEPGEVTCFPRQTKISGTIKKADLGDFRILEKAYISDSYVVGLYVVKNQLWRIVKDRQPFIDPSTRKKNISMNAPWMLEKVGLTKKTVSTCRVLPKLFRFTNAIVIDDKLYVLSNQSNTRKILFYAVN